MTWGCGNSSLTVSSNDCLELETGCMPRNVRYIHSEKHTWAITTSISETVTSITLNLFLFMPSWRFVAQMHHLRWRRAVLPLRRFGHVGFIHQWGEDAKDPWTTCPGLCPMGLHSLVAITQAWVAQCTTSAPQLEEIPTTSPGRDLKALRRGDRDGWQITDFGWQITFFHEEVDGCKSFKARASYRQRLHPPGPRGNAVTSAETCGTTVHHVVHHR